MVQKPPEFNKKKRAKIGRNFDDNRMKNDPKLSQKLEGNKIDQKSFKYDKNWIEKHLDRKIGSEVAGI